MKVRVDEIVKGKNWSRTFGVGDIAELADSMEAHGQITPVIIDGEKNLVAGFRRVAAAEKLGWETIEAVINDIGRDPKLVNLIENMQREDQTLWEEIQSIRDVFGPEASQSEIARALSKTRPWVQPRVQVWDLPQEFLDKVRVGVAGVKEIKKRLKAQKGGNTDTPTSAGVNCPNQREIKETITDLLQCGKSAEARALSYALGALTREELFAD